MLVMLTLVVGGILARTLTRTEQVSAQRNQTMLVNAASPGVERAKAKLDRMFRSFGTGFVPSDDRISQELRQSNTDRNNPAPNYTLSDETRLDLNGDGILDNAWSFESDINGDGTKEKIGYAIITSSTNGSVGVTSSDTTKASNLVARYAALDTSKNPNPLCPQPQYSLNNAWRPTSSSSTYRKTFQIVSWAKNPKTNETVTLELQQDREAALGNRWGAWFRNDLELYPGPDFRWNGAMHTAGNYVLTNNGGTGSGGSSTVLHLVSAPNSCIFSRAASQISANMFTAANLVNNNNIPFTGQLIIGSNKLNTTAGTVQIDLYKDEGPTISTTSASTDDRIEVTPNNDSVTNAFTPINISLNPRDIFTLGISNPRGYAPATQNGSVREASWDNNPIVSSRRFMNQFAVQPYVDDAYRADDRWGPKPNYVDPETGNSYSMQQASRVNGDAIANIPDLTRNDPTNTTLTNFGLDGYWERRATRQGVKLIVSQRLELGNTFGWQGASDPLYPFDPSGSVGTMGSRRHELKQWKAYRDNLAAVQSMAIYHYQSNNGEYPVACMATTAHPGTAQTITNSTTFTNLPNSGNLRVDFLTGNGTNGMEFAPLDRTTFETAISNANSDLRKALSNLAYFSGDPQGAFPAVQEAAGGVVHPFPTLTMWGDFSNLRRVIKALNDGTAYTNLSLADRTTLQTATCTLGMLAYNLRNLQLEVFNQSSSSLQTLGTALNTLNTSSSPTGLTVAQRDQYSLFRAGTASTPISTAQQQILDRLRVYFQIVSDRQFGLLSDTIVNGTARPKSTREALCDAVFSRMANLNSLTSAQKSGFKAALCSSDALIQARYPSLYYLFPLATHGHQGLQSTSTPNVPAAATAAGYGQQATQPTSESYVSDLQIFNSNAAVSSINCKPTNSALTICQTDVYRALKDANSDGVDDDLTTSFSNLFISPRTTTSSWITPVAVNQTGRSNRITVNGTVWNPAFLDDVIFNGREMMPVRVLDVDLDMLRNTQYAGQDFWLPLPAGNDLANTGAILYAFREDAMREDAIARPSGTAMNATSATPTDPAVDAVTRISPKPVDFYADPDRRPYGFRLRNGLSLVRNGRASDGRGMAFVSDQPVYVQGDFNVHSTNGTTSTSNLLEEFTQKLLDDWSNFYQRTTLDTRFARSASDTWRPVEILSDAISVLSSSFCDGNILDGLNDTNTNSSCPSGGNSSFRNMNRPSTASVWWREGENGGAADQSGNTAFPVAFNRNGLVMVSNGGATPTAIPYANGYLQFSDGKTRGSAGTSRVNAIFVSGLIPSQAQQGYGGLHNFPRFLENWGTLFYQGSFMQLSFSSYATGPFDQDAWEPGQTAQSAEYLNYYGAPTRRWGFDTALLLSPPGVVSQRFRQLTPNNNEVYRELAKDDPYVCLLRKRLDSDTSDCR
jgi:hypothetical protein